MTALSQHYAWLLLAMVFSLQFEASAAQDVCFGLPTKSASHTRACEDGNMLSDGYRYKYNEGRCSSAFDCERKGLALPCTGALCNVVTVFAPTGKPGQEGLYGWCCRNSTDAPKMDVCNPISNNICDCYSIATRTTRCRTPDGLFIPGAESGRIIEPQNCAFGFSDGLGLRCSVVWSTTDQKCGLSYTGTHDEFCKDRFRDQKSCEASDCCIWARTGCTGSASRPCSIHRTWSREELESAAAAKCPSGGQTLDANMISRTVCLKRNGYYADDCWNIGCLRCLLVVCVV